MLEDLGHDQQHTNNEEPVDPFDVSDALRDSSSYDQGSSSRSGSRSLDDTDDYVLAALGSSVPSHDGDYTGPKHASSPFDDASAFVDNGSFADPDSQDFEQQYDQYDPLDLPDPNDPLDPRIDYGEAEATMPVDPNQPRGQLVLRNQQLSDMYRYFDVDRYRGAEQGRRRKIGLRIALVVVLVFLLSVAAAASIYVSNINARLSANVTDALRDQLVQSTPGDPFYLLLLGVDKDQSRIEDTENYGSDEHAYRSDSIMLCRIDPKEIKVAMVSIHRDTLIDMGRHGDQKINAAYAFGGAAYATKIVSEFAGVPISHYAEIDLDRFISIVDQVGGVTVTLPVPVYDPEYTGLDLPAGTQTLNGTEAALLCRCRHGYDEYGDGDRFRAANQRMVFSEVIKTVLQSDPATIASTVSTMADSVTTDMSVEDILELALQMQTLNVDTDIVTGMEPTDGELIDGTWYEICLVSDWQKMMKRVDKGLPPYEEEEGEYDSTAGIAGGVGESGKKAAEAAEEVGRLEANESEDESESGEGEGEDSDYDADEYYDEDYN